MNHDPRSDKQQPHDHLLFQALKQLAVDLRTLFDLAVKEERYEDAARIRDEIKRLESIH